MNYELEIQRDRPAVFNNLDGALPPLVAGSGSARVVTTPVVTPFLGWDNTRQGQSFTLEVWHLPTATGLVIGHPAEGVFYANGIYSLRVNLGDATYIEDSWVAPEEKARHVVVTYDASRISLYIDGDQVIGLDMPKLASFESTGIGVSISNGIYDSLALYYRVLTLSQIREHYAWGRTALRSTDISSSKGASTWTLTFADVDVFQTIVFDSSNWTNGLMTNIASMDPLTATGAGSWEVMIPVGAMQESTPGIYVSWAGRATVSYSINGTTWTQIANKSTILQDTDLTDVYLSLRAEIADGESLESVSVYLLADRIMQPFNGTRPLTFKSASMDETPGHQLEYQTDAGASIRGGYIEIQPDPDSNSSIRAVEMWAKSSSPITLSPAVSKTYTNGVEAATYNGNWSHYVFVLTSDIVGPIRIGNNMNINIGSLAVYPTTLTAAQVSALYSYNVGAPAITVSDTSQINVTETDPVVEIYSYTWSIVSA